MKARTTDALVLLCSIIIVAAALTWVVPAGHDQRSHNAQNDQTQVGPGSYKSSPAHPVGLWGVLVSIPEGRKAAAEIVFFVLMGGAALTVADVSLANWWRFIIPIYLVLSAISVVAILVAVRIGLQ